MIPSLTLVALLLVPPQQTVEVSLDRSAVATVRGERFTLETRILNQGPEPTEPLIVYLNVASLPGNVSVDPEDWSPAPNCEIAPLAPGAAVVLSWDLKAGDIGSFDLFVVLLPNGATSAGKGPLIVSTPVHVTSVGQNPLTTDETLPVVVTVPLLLGLLAVTVYVRRRRQAALGERDDDADLSRRPIEVSSWRQQASRDRARTVDSTRRAQ